MIQVTAAAAQRGAAYVRGKHVQREEVPRTEQPVAPSWSCGGRVSRACRLSRKSDQAAPGLTQHVRTSEHCARPSFPGHATRWATGVVRTSEHGQPGCVPESLCIPVPRRPPAAAQRGADDVRGKQVRREEVTLAEQPVVPFLERRGQPAATAVSAEGGARLRLGSHSMFGRPNTSAGLPSPDIRRVRRPVLFGRPNTNNPAASPAPAVSTESGAKLRLG
jgi:hypothetical protein